MPSSGRLRILLWHWGRRGAGPRYTLELARALMRYPEAEIHLSVSRECELIPEFRALNLPMLEVRTYSNAPSALFSSLNILSTRKKFARYLAENRIDIVNSTMSHYWSRFITSSVKSSGAALLNTVHDAVLHPGEDGGLKSWFFQPFSDADGYIAFSHHVARQLSGLHNIPPEKIAVIPLAPLSDPVFPCANRADNDHLRLLFFGRILPYKGLERLIEAYALLRREGVPITLQITGAGDMRKLMPLVNGLPGIGIHNHWVPETKMGSVFASADVIVLPYLESSQSGIVASAFAAGVPAIATPIGGLPEQITDGINGLIAADTSPTALAQAIRRLAEDDALLSHLRQGALHTVQQQYSWDVVSTGVIALSRKCLGAGGA